ncbi:syntaxin-17 [Brienomyrus brachyistius]|uniref:syntaxin-17 n=1 Tax=Brienomyrus brachyistius TaxID=42636 RepID=UPI0020B227E2|nr:syntaxin-17 [Brienomyrus brachyistius]XP_048881555.1 syntaxin-17 [Brienomyrus brachyistius]
MADETEKLSLRRLEQPIQKFIKVAIPTDLERLQKHQMNIEKFQRCQQWDRLHQEHINASRTVQQLRANVREMEKLCGRVRREDALALEKMVQPTRDRASEAVQDFLGLLADAKPQPGPSAPAHADAMRGKTLNVAEGEHPPATQAQLLLPEIPEHQNAAESWESLEEDLLELNGLVNEFSELVHSQQGKIDSIEDNISRAAGNVEEGTQSLGKAAKYKMAVLPLAGALLGGVVGGPLGLLAGFKAVGVAAAVGGGVLGFAGGSLVQRTQRAKVDLELQKVSGAEGGCKKD